MMRNKAASSMQKTYDECYLRCSTAVYFEGQNNEAEALRLWRSALDQIYYHNAYKLPTNYCPRSETEKALQDSLKELEVQCKERVDLLEALKRSRRDIVKAERDESQESRRLVKSKEDKPPTPGRIGDGTVPPFQYPDIPKPPALPPRPSLPNRKSTESITPRSKSFSQSLSPRLPAPPALPVHTVPQTSRSPSPDRSCNPTMLTNKKTMFRTLRRGSNKPRTVRINQQNGAPLKAASMAWDTISGASSSPDLRKGQHEPTIQSHAEAIGVRSFDQLDIPSSDAPRTSDSGDYIPDSNWRDMQPVSSQELPNNGPQRNLRADLPEVAAAAASVFDRPIMSADPRPSPVTQAKLTKPPNILYRNEFPPSVLKSVPSSKASTIAAKARQRSPEGSKITPVPAPRKALPDLSADRVSRTSRKVKTRTRHEDASGSEEDSTIHRHDQPATTSRRSRPHPADSKESPDQSSTPPSSSEATTTGDHDQEESSESILFERRKAAVVANLPKNVDLPTATQILNEIIVHGDEVHWTDVAGLDAAKNALKEAVVYPFLRPDLFMGLREPARGMLLFGPPGTGKTMLARAVATESKSTFFAVSASSLTSKWHGESEKLVRALFAIARRLAPSIIFVDEIDSLLGTRGGGGGGSEHEASRRSKTEFLTQWSDLQKAAVGKEKDTSGKGLGDGVGQGDPTRVLVLAATNMPWDIDEAARRRFVRRQYIPLPEAETRKVQIKTLLGHQKHELSEEDIEVLTQVTEGFSGSDITALAKDAAMGPLRKLGEALLYTPKEFIRPITVADFEASLVNIRPSVGQAGLKAYEDWAREFGERGG